MSNIKTRVLVVEDNADELKLSKYLLESAGLEVISATNAGECLSILESHCQLPENCFDLIILDVDLPDITGTTLGDYIRAKHQNLPIVFYTGYGKLPVIVETTKRLGATLVTKPIDPDRFLEIILKSIRNQPQTPIIETKEPLSLKFILRVARNPSAHLL